MCSPEEANDEFKCPTARKQNEFICFWIWMKIISWFRPFPQAALLTGNFSDHPDRNHFQRSSNYCIAKLFSSLTPFQSRMHYYPLNPPKYCANASFAFNFYQACFPGKSQLLRFSFMKVSRSNYFYRVRWDQIQLYSKIAIVFSKFYLVFSLTRRLLYMSAMFLKYDQNL